MKRNRKMADCKSEKAVGVAGVVRVERTHDRVKAGYGPVSSHACMSPLFPVGAEGRVAGTPRRYSVLLQERLAASPESTLSFVFYISAGTQYCMPALKAGKKQQVFMPAGIRAVIAVTAIADCGYCT